MPNYTLSFKPATCGFGDHDPSAVIFEDNKILYGIEEERFTREKHAHSTFPRRSIQACLDYAGTSLSNVNEIVLPYDPDLWLDTSLIKTLFRQELAVQESSDQVGILLAIVEKIHERHADAVDNIKSEIEETQRVTDIPPVSTRCHHLCHAASAFHPSGFDEAVVVSVDGRGESDSTVVWHGTRDGLKRIETYKYPNSLGQFFGTITELLGFRYGNGEGKLMGLASYGDRNAEISEVFRDRLTSGVEYDVTALTNAGVEVGMDRLRSWFGRSFNEDTDQFDQWEKDLARTAQYFLEKTVIEIIEKYCAELGCANVCLAGGVALNCKMNKRVMQSSSVDSVFIQPIASDAGLAIGGGLLNHPPVDIDTMDNVYLGPNHFSEDIKFILQNEDLIEFDRPNNLERVVARSIADGKLIGWFQGRTEMGPRALGNRSILADPRTIESRDRVNEFVKHREKWRPFAPSMTERAAESYLIDVTDAPFMIKAFDTISDAKNDIPAVLHPEDNSTRPQIVSWDENPRYYQLIEQFGEATGVEVLLNTSFNDNGEPIVNTPKQALDDFLSMGLDILVLEDAVIRKI